MIIVRHLHQWQEEYVLHPYTDPEGLSAFSQSVNIALDRNPGVIPIGVGEVCRHIVGKAILSVISMNVQKSDELLQLCQGNRVVVNETACNTCHIRGL